MNKSVEKIVKIRLGSSCNLNCEFCHSNKYDNYKLNKQIIPFIKYNHYTKINYSGGEPFLFFDIIKYFLSIFGNLRHFTVTNGTLLTEDIINITNQYDFRLVLSFNDNTIPKLTDVNCNALRKVKELGVSRLYLGNKTLDQLDEELDEFSKILGRKLYAGYNLRHCVGDSTIEYSQSQINEYLEGISLRIDLGMKDFINRKITNNLLILLHMVNRTMNPDHFGCDDINYFTPITLDGRVMICSYEPNYVCNINNITYNKIKRIRNSSKCKKCPMRGMCEACFLNNNDQECFIYQNIRKHVIETLNTYNMNYYDIIKFGHDISKAIRNEEEYIKL